MGESPTRAQKILRRTWTGAALAAAVVLLFVLAERFGPWPVLVVSTLLALAAAVEVDRMGSLAGRDLGGPLALLALVVGGLSWRFGDTITGDTFTGDTIRGGLRRAWLAGAPALALGGAALQPLFAAARRRPATSHDARAAAFLTFWILAPLALLPFVWEVYGRDGMIALIVLSKVGDIAGYYVGNAVGRHHPFPRLSPGKTTEGCLGSLVGGALAGGLLAVAGLVSGGFAHGLLVGAVLNLAAQAGDLLESRVKRGVGVKDSSTWLGASGGFLDVLDSLLLTVPVAVLFWPAGL